MKYADCSLWISAVGILISPVCPNELYEAENNGLAIRIIAKQKQKDNESDDFF